MTGLIGFYIIGGFVAMVVGIIIIASYEEAREPISHSVEKLLAWMFFYPVLLVIYAIIGFFMVLASLLGK